MIELMFCAIGMLMHDVRPQRIVYVRPSYPSIVNCPTDDSGDHCYTFDEWIERNDNKNHTFKLFTNETTVYLLPGIHNITVTTENIVTFTEAHSIELTGKVGETVVLLPHTFQILFHISVTNISISNLIFKSQLHEIDLESAASGKPQYAVNLRVAGAVLIENVQFHDKGIIISDAYSQVAVRNCNFFSRCRTSSFEKTGILFNSVMWFCTNDLKSVYIQNSIFSSTVLDVQTLISTSSTCNNLEIIVQQSVFDTTIGDCNSTVTTIKVKAPSRLVIMDVSVRNTKMDLESDYIEFSGYNLFHDSAFGTTVTVRYLFKVKSGSKLEFIGNHVEDLSSVFHLLLPYSDEKIFRPHVNQITLQIGEEHSEVNTTISFINNTAKDGHMMVLNGFPNVRFSNTKIFFIENKGIAKDIKQAILVCKDAAMYFFKVYMTFENNSASGIVSLENSTIDVLNIFHGIFRYNTAQDGGAMSFYKGSQLIAKTTKSHHNTFLHFESNYAFKRGGAIFVEDSDYIDGVTSILSKQTFILCLHQLVEIHFYNNSAGLAGSNVYGGWIDTNGTTVKRLTCKSLGPFLLNLGADMNLVSSNPLRICICRNSTPNCSILDYSVDIFPGQTIEFEAITVGQRQGISPSIVLAQFTDTGEGSVARGQDVQSIGRQCSSLKFTILSAKVSKTISLRLLTQGTGIPNLRKLEEIYEPTMKQNIFDKLSISLHLHECPLGFELYNKRCTCLAAIEEIKDHGLYCDYDTFTIVKDKQKWITVTFEHNSTSYHGVIIHDHCPFDYCKSISSLFSFKLETPNDQCAFFRSGVLCGSCQVGFSRMLASSRCAECSNKLVFVLIPVIIFAGILLVIFIMTLNLTVSSGTTNGLIFYANIVRANQAIFFPPSMNSSFLSIFIAWLNLDFGIEVCFYNGLDTYTASWLQFLFPMYIWILVILIIVVSHYSSNVSKFMGRNAVQVLATLFLLSYTKTLRVAISVLTSTSLKYPDGFTKKVWLYDGNVDFLYGKHIPLFIACLLFLILVSAPYTTVLTSIQWFQKLSHYCIFRSVSKLMPLFDAYTGPYKYKHRYWTGLLLLVRVFILLAFTFNTSNNPSVNLLTISVIAFLTLVYFTYMDVYRSSWHNFLEIASLINIELLSIGSFYQLLNGNSTETVTVTSTTIAFIIFIMVTCQHAIQKLLLLNKVKDIKQLVDIYF